MSQRMMRPHIKIVDLAKLAEAEPVIIQPNLETGGKAKVADVQPTQKVIVNSIDDSWIIEGVSYRNEIYTVDLAKQLLCGGEAKTQDEWAVYSEEAREQGEHYTPDYPLTYGTAKALFSAREDPTRKDEVEEARKFLQSNARAKYLMTLTRIAYQPKGKDIVIHNYKMKDQIPEKINFVGADGEISTQNPLVFKALLGTDNIQEISEVFRWLNGTSTYLWRVNKKPEKIDERVAWFGAGSGGACLCCGGGPGSCDSSLGVRAVRKNF